MCSQSVIHWTEIFQTSWGKQLQGLAEVLQLFATAFIVKGTTSKIS